MSNKDNVTTLIKIENGIVNPATVVFAITEVKEYFSEFNQNQPPLPENPISFIPFDLHVTETTDEKNQRIGRIQFTKDDGKVCYDATWNIEKKDNDK